MSEIDLYVLKKCKLFFLVTKKVYLCIVKPKETMQLLDYGKVDIQ